MTTLGICGGVTLLVGRQRTVGLAKLLLALAANTLAAGASSGCSGKLPNRNLPYTSPGTYEILVTATDGTITNSAAYSLTVTTK